jgi:hypothetical protein
VSVLTEVYLSRTGQRFAAGDLVIIEQSGSIYDWQEAEGQIGVILGFTKRLHIPAVRVMVLGEVYEFDHDELEVARVV